MPNEASVWESDPLIARLIRRASRWSATEIGADRGFTGRTLKLDWETDDGEHTAVVKIPDVTENYLRCAREIRFFETLAPALGDRVPGFLCAHETTDPPHVALAIEHIEGIDGDAELGCSPEVAAQILKVLAELHAYGIHDPAARAHPWLPRWGQGVLGAKRPHRKRAERFVKRAELMRSNYGDHIGPMIDAAIRTLPHGLEDMLARAFAFAPTLIHADVHLDNILLRARDDTPPSVVLLDWQSVSVGPAGYDVVRLLTGALRGPSDQAATGELIDAYIDFRRAFGAPIHNIASFKQELRLLARLVIVGFVSGCASLTAANTPMRHVRMIQTDLGDDGLPGACHAIEALR